MTSDPPPPLTTLRLRQERRGQEERIGLEKEAYRLRYLRMLIAKVVNKDNSSQYLKNNSICVDTSMPSSPSYVHTINYCEAPQIAPIIPPKALDATMTPDCAITVTPAAAIVTPLNVEAVTAAAAAVPAAVAAEVLPAHAKVVA